MSIEIRELRPDDHGQVLTLWPEMPKNNPSNAPTPQQLMQRPSNLSVVARDDKRIVGVMLCARIDGTYQHRVAVADSHRDTELKRQLIDKALCKLRSVKAARCRIHLSESDSRMWESAKWWPDEPCDPAHRPAATPRVSAPPRPTTPIATAD